MQEHKPSEHRGLQDVVAPKRPWRQQSPKLAGIPHHALSQTTPQHLFASPRQGLRSLSPALFPLSPKALDSQEVWMVRITRDSLTQ